MIAMLVATIFAAIIFYEIFVMLKALTHVATMRATMNGSFEVMKSSTMADEEKGEALRRAGLSMYASVGLLTAKFAGAGAAAACVLFVSSLAGGWPFDRLLGYSVSPVALAATLASLTVYGFMRHGRRR